MDVILYPCLNINVGLAKLFWSKGPQPEIKQFMSFKIMILIYTGVNCFVLVIALYSGVLHGLHLATDANTNPLPMPRQKLYQPHDNTFSKCKPQYFILKIHKGIYTVSLMYIAQLTSFVWVCVLGII